MTKVIGLTGSIGSGKSTVARLLAELGATVIDADKLGHEVYRPGTEAWREVVVAFGQRVLTAGGKINRTRLGEIVFNSPEALARLDRITHPRIYKMVKARIDEYRQQKMSVVVLEAPLLIEAKWTPLVDEVWITIAPESKVFERIRKQRGLSREETMARIRSQLPVEELLKHARIVINNESGLAELKKQVTGLWTGLAADAKQG